MMQRKKILIVDPSPIARRELKTTIENHETLVDVYTAANVDQAGDILRSHPPDVAFIETDLPLDAGLDLIQLIRGEAPESRIVALAHNALETVRSAALEKGADDFFTKEMSVGFRLIDFIHEVIRR